MANKNPTGGERAVSLDLPAQHITILRERLADWLAGAREDLKAPERLEDPDQTRREAQAYERLLVGLSLGQIFIPDEEARAAVEAAAEAYDEESNYAEVVASHDALHGSARIAQRGRRAMNPVAANFGNNLRYCRERAKFSQEDLSFAAGLHRTEIGLLERGERLPRIDTLVKLAGDLSIPPEELLDGLGWQPGSIERGGFQISPSEGK